MKDDSPSETLCDGLCKTMHYNDSLKLAEIQIQLQKHQEAISLLVNSILELKNESRSKSRQDKSRDN